jgi:hypothetical protein
MRQTDDFSRPDEAERTMKEHSENQPVKVTGIDLAQS